MYNRVVGIIGHFGGNENFYDGQTIKTRILYDELKGATGYSLIIADTYYKNKNVIKLLVQTFKVLIEANDIIMLLSGNGMKIYFPLLYIMAKIFHKRIYHDVIGGNLADYCLKYPKYVVYLNAFIVNWVENVHVKEKLIKVGVKNAEFLPNFKRLKIVENINHNYKLPYKLCTFSRVMKQKGIEDAINAVQMVNKMIGKPVFLLDIYGQIDENEKSWFRMLEKNFSSEIKYGGIIQYDKSTDVLKDYFALLFPTLFFTEGVPGTIIDAYAAGLPVISSKWEHFHDVIKDGITGIGYTFGDVGGLIQVLLDVYENPDKIVSLKENCIKYASDYMPEKSIKIIVNKIESIS